MLLISLSLLWADAAMAIGCRRAIARTCCGRQCNSCISAWASLLSSMLSRQQHGGRANAMLARRSIRSPLLCRLAGVQAWLEAWFSATGAALEATPVVVTELTADPEAASPPREAAPGVFLARLGPQERLHPRRIGEPPSACRSCALLIT